MMNKKITYPPELRVWSIVLMFLFSVGIFGQTAHNPVLTWDQEVGCIEYDDKGERGDTGTYVDLLENIEEGKCIRFCEDTVVHYTFNANNVQHVNWQVTGGTLHTGSTNTSAAIQWGANGNGNLTLTVTYTDNTVEVLSVCVEKIAKPKAYFEIDGVDPGEHSFCTNATISFNNLSSTNNGSDIVSYLWDFGDGTFSNSFEPSHTYTAAGYYVVELIVTNSCNCSDTFKTEIYITDELAVNITCASVVCEGAHETYSVNDGCGGEWRVIGGSIIADNGTSIDVIWDQVDPADGFGYVSYRSHCSCPNWNTVKIPVILGHGTIKGPDVICEGKQGRFTLPQWPTTDFIWAIDGNEYHPMLVLTDQRNEIVVDGMAPGTYTLSVRYHNTLINGGKCGGEAKIQFKVVENVEIVTDEPLTVCTGETKNFISHNGMPVSWEISLGGTILHTAFGPDTSYTFNTGGIYVVTANNNGCISDPVIIDVIEKPVITGVINGPAYVCLNVPYTFEISENEPGVIYVWSISSGTGSIVGSNAGIKADFTFSSPSATIQVVKQMVKNGVICESETIYFDVNQLDVSATISNNSGLTQFCPSSTSVFTADLSGMDVDHIEWKIVGAGSTTNFGSIIQGINNLTVEVGFNEISGGVNIGELQLYVTKCSETKVFTYPIQLITLPTISLAPVDGVCPSSTNIEINVTTSNSLPAAVQVSYNGGPFSTISYPFASGVSFMINNEFTNYTSGNVAQTLTVRLVNMCTYTPTATQTVTIYPLTQIDITPGYDYVVCPANYSPITLYANISTGITSSVTYEWFKDGQSISTPSSTNQYTISTATQGSTPGGEYYVVVVDGNGCIVTSAKVEVEESCGNGTGPGGGNCTGNIDPNVSMNASWSSCGAISGTVISSSGYTPIISWWGSPHLTLDPLTQGTPNGVFTSTVPGVHIVKVYLTYGDCTVVKTTTVIKHYEPKVKAAITCTGSGNYTVELLNNSTIFGVDFNDLDFEFSGPGITGSTVGDTYTINGVSPGTYTYNMTMHTPGNLNNPMCTVPITVTIDSNPSTNFTLETSYCSEESVTLNIPGGTMLSGYEYRWVFNGTSYVASGLATDINFDVLTDTDFDITLRITNPYGCVFETNPAVKAYIKKANFSVGAIVPMNADYCEGSALPLSFSPAFGSPAPGNIIWMRDNIQVGTGLSYLPTQSGSYWPVLIDANNNCKSYIMAEHAVSYKLRKPPFASISGNTSVCYGENTTLTGIFTDSAIEHRWALNGSPVVGTMGSWVTGNSNLTMNLNGLAPGSYDYSFETRYISDTSCINSFAVTVVVHPPVNPPLITYDIENCQPYTLRLTANGPADGTYNWSNGATGQTISVTQGGAYSVTYTAPTGCTATGYTQAPHNPERALWVVPNGCYTMCLNNGEYLLGPLGIYEGYEWTINGAVSQSGSNTFVPNQPITMAGFYQLSITQMGCTFSSNTPHITADKNCDDLPPCKITGGIRSIDPADGGYYFLSVYLINPNSYPITVNLSSLYGYGTYSPSTVTLNPGANTIYPLYFYPNSSYVPGVTDGLVIQMPDCMDVWDLRFPSEIYPKPAAEIVEPQLVLSPNPASETTTADFNVGTEYQNAQSITVYDVTGVQRLKATISGKQGEVTLNVNNLAPGTYMVNLEGDGKRIAQQKLIKK